MVDIGLLDTLLVAAGRLHRRGQPLEPRLGQEGGKRAVTDLAEPDVLVAVLLRAERVLRVVEVEGFQTVLADPGLEVVDDTTFTVRLTGTSTRLSSGSLLSTHRTPS